MFAVLITGPPGAGKTSVLTALSDALSDDDVRHAAIEAEALRWAHPGLSDEQEMRHVSAMSALYREAGCPLILVGQTIETDEDLARILDAIGAEESFVVRLEAHPDTLAERIIRREPEGWSGVSGLVEHARRLATLAPGSGTIDLVLSTEGRRPEAVAQELCAAITVRLQAEAS